jgi:rhodanese-related sulfurtransferase
MLNRRFVAEAAVLVLAAVALAVASNAFAERHRKLAWKADYPNAMTVTRRPAFVPAAFTPPPAEMSAAAATPSVIESQPQPSDAAAPLPSPVTAAQASPTATPSATAAVPTATPPPAPKPAKAFPSTPDRPFVEISPEDALELYGRKALFIDARRTSEFNAGHIAGSRSMPVWESDVDERVGQLFEEGRDQQAPVVIYCSGGNCEDSHMLAQKLWGVGFDNVLVYRDGYPDWVKRGGAVMKGSNR